MAICKWCDKPLKAHEVAEHNINCLNRPKREKPFAIPMSVIEDIASGKFKATVSFICAICEEDQEIPDDHIFGKEIVFPVCNKCKKELKKFVLSKR